MDIAQARQLPALAGLDDDGIVDALHQAYYPDLPREQVAQSLGVKLTAPPPPPAPERTVMGTIGDAALNLGKGIVGVPQAAVGLADMATGGRVGKALEDGVEVPGTDGFRVRYDPNAASGMLDSGLSAAQQHANREVQEAEGFWNTVKAVLRNPSTAAMGAIESLPMTAGGGVLARGGMAAAPKLAAALGPKLAPLYFGALGEGVGGAGQAAEQIRQGNPDGLLTGEQSALSAASGAGTALFGVIGGKVANRFGFADIDTMFAGAAINGKAAKLTAKAILEGFLSEGALEELPQSIHEQVIQNLAQNKPLDEGVNQAAVLGFFSGGLMGGGANVYHGVQAARKKDEPSVLDQEVKDAAAGVSTPSSTPPGAAPKPTAPTPGDVMRATSVDTAIDAAMAAVGASITGTDPASLLGSPLGGGMINSNPNAALVQAGQQAAEDQHQDALGDAAVGNIRQEAEANTQSQRQYDPLTLPRKGLPTLDEAVQAGDILTPKTGAPFTQAAANLRLKHLRAEGKDAQLVPVAEGGFIIRPTRGATDATPSNRAPAGAAPAVAVPAAPAADAAPGRPNDVAGGMAGAADSDTRGDGAAAPVAAADAAGADNAVPPAPAPGAAGAAPAGQGMVAQGNVAGDLSERGRPAVAAGNGAATEAVTDEQSPTSAPAPAPAAAPAATGGQAPGPDTAGGGGRGEAGVPAAGEADDPLSTARAALPPGYLIQDTGKTLNVLYGGPGGRRVAEGIGRTGSGAQEALRQARVDAEKRGAPVSRETQALTDEPSSAAPAPAPSTDKSAPTSTDTWAAAGAEWTRTRDVDRRPILDKAGLPGNVVFTSWLKMTPERREAIGRAMGFQPTYAQRKVLNAQAIIDWATSQGFKATLPAEKMHVTIAYSSTAMDPLAVGNQSPAYTKGAITGKAGRKVERLGAEGAVVLKFDSPVLTSRWQQYGKAGASWDFEGFQPHITITYQPGDVDLSKVQPYTGPIQLGPELVEPIKPRAVEEQKASEKPTADEQPRDPKTGEFVAEKMAVGDTVESTLSNDRRRGIVRRFLDAANVMVQWDGANEPRAFPRDQLRKVGVQPTPQVPNEPGTKYVLPSFVTGGKAAPASAPAAEKAPGNERALQILNKRRLVLQDLLACLG